MNVSGASWRKKLLIFSLIFIAGMSYAQTKPAPSPSITMENHPPASLNEPQNKERTPNPPPGFPPSDSVPPPPPKRPGNIMNYRGTRTYSEKLPLKVRNIKCSRVKDDMVCMEIIFNQNINPRSIKKSSILIDGFEIEPLPKFSFNKRGDMFRFELPLYKEEFELKINGISSFDGSLMEEVIIDMKLEG